MSDLTLDVGQACEVKEAFRRGKWSNADVKRFSQSDPDRMRLFREVMLGRAVININVMRHVIDCDTNPYLPNGWTVKEHRKGGQMEWDSLKVALHLSPNQMGNKRVKGNKLRKELANIPVMNANVLDYLLAHTELISEEWKGKVVFFWGTIYRDSGGNLCVRYLCWRHDRWDWCDHWLGNDWRSGHPAAVSQVST
ncbi:MAG TPA: hypothetical protein PLF31_03010 [Candidatus Paceibacterota bacterium]|nr:hypothetical protein [Candidatus Paceibacterota bacterium]